MTITEKDTRPSKGRIRLLGEVIYQILVSALYDVLKWGVVKIGRRKKAPIQGIRSNIVTITVTDKLQLQDSVSVTVADPKPSTDA